MTTNICFSGFSLIMTCDILNEIQETGKKKRKNNVSHAKDNVHAGAQKYHCDTVKSVSNTYGYKNTAVECLRSPVRPDKIYTCCLIDTKWLESGFQGWCTWDFIVSAQHKHRQIVAGAQWALRVFWCSLFTDMKIFNFFYLFSENIEIYCLWWNCILFTYCREIMHSVRRQPHSYHSSSLPFPERSLKM